MVYPLEGLDASRPSASARPGGAYRGEPDTRLPFPTALSRLRSRRTCSGRLELAALAVSFTRVRNMQESSSSGPRGTAAFTASSNLYTRSFPPTCAAVRYEHIHPRRHAEFRGN